MTPYQRETTLPIHLTSVRRTLPSLLTSVRLRSTLTGGGGGECRQQCSGWCHAGRGCPVWSPRTAPERARSRPTPVRLTAADLLPADWPRRAAPDTAAPPARSAGRHRCTAASYRLSRLACSAAGLGRRVASTRARCGASGPPLGLPSYMDVVPGRLRAVRKYCHQ